MTGSAGGSSRFWSTASDEPLLKWLPRTWNNRTTSRRRSRRGNENWVSEVAYICPGGDSPATELAGWGAQLRTHLESDGYSTSENVTVATPCDRNTSEAALRGPSALLFFFGHGSESALLGTDRHPLIEMDDFSKAIGKTIVSVACEAGLELGPAAIQAGVRAHLGWNVLLLWLGPDASLYGDTIINPLALLGKGSSLGEVEEELRRSLNEIARHYRPLINRHPNQKLAYYAAAAAAGQLALDGDRHVRPLSRGLSSAVRRIMWKAQTIIVGTPRRPLGGNHDN